MSLNVHILKSDSKYHVIQHLHIVMCCTVSLLLADIAACF